MRIVPVCIIGCGPIGLAGALLLSKFGIKTLIIERRSDVNTHPRSRFVDTNTMELMRFFGIEKMVEDTGLGPDWTDYNRWFTALTKDQIAAIPSPTFHTVPRTTSPTMPVMTCQDYVENCLHSVVDGNEHIEILHRTEAIGLSQDEDGTTVVIKDIVSDEESSVRADYTIGTDGPHSFVREQIGSTLITEPFQVFSQDVIFEADLSKYADRKGGLMYVASPSGFFVFQPLNGITRWRCQITVPTNEIRPEEWAVERIREAVGADEEISISITSMGMWQPTPGCVDNLSKGRIFLAGDAAHVSVPTGGMGNNIGFFGIRNLAWKLAFVLKGLANPEILETYAIEHKPCALDRIATGVQTTLGMMKIFSSYYANEDTAEAIEETSQYADYDGVILGFEMESVLIAENPDPPPQVNNTTKDFIPSVRAGRRAPHAWVDEGAGTSVLDWFGLEYVLVVGGAVDSGRWQSAIESVRASTDYPIRLEQLPDQDLTPYRNTELALVRPDGIIADVWSDAAVEDDLCEHRISAMLATTS